MATSWENGEQYFSNLTEMDHDFKENSNDRKSNDFKMNHYGIVECLIMGLQSIHITAANS